MIVNPAYSYYTKSGPLPDFNLWDGNVVNVPYTLNQAQWIPKSGEFIINSYGYVEFTVNSKGYSRFRIEALVSSISVNNIEIIFYNASGSLISSVSEQMEQVRTYYTVDIPIEARNAGTKIRIKSPGGSNKTIYSATLQE